MANYGVKEKPASPYVRSFTEGIYKIASSGAKTPALGYSLATLRLNIVNKALGKPQLEVPEFLYDNSLVRALDSAANSNSYLQEHFKDENLGTLLSKKEFSKAGEYIAHQVVVNAPQHVATILATLSGLGAPALVTLGTFGALSAAEATAKGAKSDADPVGQTTNAIISGASEVLFERLGTVGVVSNLKKTLIKKFGDTAADITIRSVSKEMAKAIVKAGATEGIEEAMTSVTQNLGENFTGVDQNDFREILGNSVESAVVGAISGGAFSAPLSATNVVKIKNLEANVKRAVEKNGGQYEKTVADVADPENREFQFKDINGNTQSVSLKNMSIAEVALKADPSLENGEKYIEEMIEQVDSEQQDLNHVEVMGFKRRVEDIVTGHDSTDPKAERKKLNKEQKATVSNIDSLLYRVTDFAENPDILNKEIKINDTDTTVGEYLESNKPEEFLKYKAAEKLYSDVVAGTANPKIAAVLHDVLEAYQKKGQDYKDKNFIKKTRGVYVDHTLESDFDESLKDKVNKSKVKASKERQYDTLIEAMIYEDKAPAKDGLVRSYDSYINRMSERYATSLLKDKLLKDKILLTEEEILEQQKSNDQYIKDNTVYIKGMSSKKTGRPLAAGMKNGKIYINKSEAERLFKEKSWTKPKVAGVKALKADQFKTYEKWENFLKYHEYSHIESPKKKDESQAQYENRMNNDALRKTNIMSDYVKVAPSDRTFKYSVDTGNLEIDPSTGEQKKIYQDKSYYAKKATARSLNVVFEDTPLRKNKITQGIRTVNALSKASRLLFSFFHYNAFGLAHMLSSPYKGHDIKESINAKNYKKAFYDINDAVNPFAGIFGGYKDGLKMWEEGNPALSLLIKHGLTLGRNQEWDEDLLHNNSMLTRMMDKFPGTKIFKNAAIKAHDEFSSLLFQKVGAGLKVKTAFLMFEDVKRKNPTWSDAKIATIVASNVNDNFGGLHLKKMRRDPTAQYIWQTFAFAPDWTESNFRLYLHALLGSDESKLNVYRATATRILTKGFIATVLLQLLAATIREPDEEEQNRKRSLLDQFVKNYAQAWKDGKLTWMKANVTPFLKAFGLDPKDRYYYGFMSFFLDPVKWISRDIKKGQKLSRTMQDFFSPERILSSLGKSAYYKASAVPQIIGDFLLDTDFTFYRDFNHFDEMINKKSLADWNKATTKPERLFVSPSQLPAYAIYEVNKFIPIPIIATISFFMGDMEASELAMNLLGQDVKRAYIKE